MRQYAKLRSNYATVEQTMTDICRLLDKMVADDAVIYFTQKPGQVIPRNVLDASQKLQSMGLVTLTRKVLPGEPEARKFQYLAIKLKGKKR